jgi:hypothetical protein
MSLLMSMVRLLSSYWLFKMISAQGSFIVQRVVSGVIPVIVDVAVDEMSMVMVNVFLVVFLLFHDFCSRSFRCNLSFHWFIKVLLLFYFTVK